RGEKIDIIPWNPEPARFVAKALSPARVREVFVDDDTKEATVIVPDDQLALAIGKEGLNARLAARLTGWRVDIQSDTEFAHADVAATHGPSATEIAAAEGEVDLDTVRPQYAPPEHVPAGVPIELEAEAPGEPTASIQSDEGTPAA